MMVVIKDELESVRSRGPVTSTDCSMDWMVSEIAVKGMISSLRRMSIK